MFLSVPIKAGSYVPRTMPVLRFAETSGEPPQTASVDLHQVPSLAGLFVEVGRSLCHRCMVLKECTHATQNLPAGTGTFLRPIYNCHGRFVTTRAMEEPGKHQVLASGAEQQ